MPTDYRAKNTEQYRPKTTKDKLNILKSLFMKRRALQQEIQENLCENNTWERIPLMKIQSN